MTVEETIKWMEDTKIAAMYMKGDKDVIAAFDMVIAALRAQQERKNPKPLTLEELRAMDDPVWCLCKPFPFEDGNGIGFWCLCKKGYILTPAGNRFHVDEIPDWVFLRHKPKEVNQSGNG